jgi:type II secretory pathway pseudopilin PulG
MKRSNQAGFTIIETMLFLGITGLLVMGILIGTGGSINTQRYRDSITSLQSFLQQQFSDVANVNNGRNNNWTCDTNGNIISVLPGSGVARGQSDCVILGKLITTTANSDVLSVKDVVGYVAAGTIMKATDVEVLAQYKTKASSINATTYVLQWGTTVVKKASNDSAVFSILIARSPLSGVIRTFVNDTAVIADGSISSLINQTALGTAAKLCVNPNGLFGGARMSVDVNAGSSSASGIETRGNDSGC